MVAHSSVQNKKKRFLFPDQKSSAKRRNLFPGDFAVWFFSWLNMTCSASSRTELFLTPACYCRWTSLCYRKATESTILDKTQGQNVFFLSLGGDALQEGHLRLRASWCFFSLLKMDSGRRFLCIPCTTEHQIFPFEPSWLQARSSRHESGLHPQQGTFFIHDGVWTVYFFLWHKYK